MVRIAVGVGWGVGVGETGMVVVVSTVTGAVGRMTEVGGSVVVVMAVVGTVVWFWVPFGVFVGRGVLVGVTGGVVVGRAVCVGSGVAVGRGVGVSSGGTVVPTWVAVGDGEGSGVGVGIGVGVIIGVMYGVAGTVVMVVAGVWFGWAGAVIIQAVMTRRPSITSFTTRVPTGLRPIITLYHSAIVKNHSASVNAVYQRLLTLMIQKRHGERSWYHGLRYGSPGLKGNN
jgi:hypothetical protein